MAKNIEPTLKLISTYLKLDESATFVIPEYQREYSWTKVHCDKLWQDIEAFIENQGADPYFFGTIIVDCKEIDGKYFFKLIDGQQRTTTFLLLLKALLLRLNAVIANIPSENSTYEGLLDSLKTSRMTIMRILYKAEPKITSELLKDPSRLKGISIIENYSINELYKDEMKIIIESKDFEEAEKNVHKFPRRQFDNKYTNHFRNFKDFYNKLSSKSETQIDEFATHFLEKCQIIEIRSWQEEQAITMFNSLNSTGMPLSDANIISAKLFSNAKDIHDIFKEQWEGLLRLTDALNTRRIVDINAVLMQYMYILRAKEQEYLRENSVDVNTPGLRRFYLEIKKDLMSKPLELCYKLTSIAEKWDLIKDFPIVKLLLKFNENVKLYIAGYLYRYEIDEITESKISSICESLLRLFTVLELVPVAYSSKNFKLFLFKAIIYLVDKDIPVVEIQEMFTKHIRESWKDDEIKEAICDYDKNILVFLNEYLYAKNKGLSFDFKDNVNVEHIMPASGRNIEIIRADAGISDKGEFDELVNKLGNKILLEEDINKSIGADWFRTKIVRSVKDKQGYKDSQYAVAVALTDYHKTTWTKDDIEAMTAKIAKRITRFIFQ